MLIRNSKQYKEHQREKHNLRYKFKNYPFYISPKILDQKELSSIMKKWQKILIS